MRLPTGAHVTQLAVHRKVLSRHSYVDKLIKLLNRDLTGLARVWQLPKHLQFEGINYYFIPHLAGIWRPA